ncbi:MAG: hypothetical protein A3K61_06850 [Thaumarchaeota archaeon RBG_16_49_8]|nr:MAG: hypothetical protein A3K61_06850 [Thaumarchaeota archaeon RBG_16_49_8]
MDPLTIAIGGVIGAAAGAVVVYFKMRSSAPVVEHKGASVSSSIGRTTPIRPVAARRVDRVEIEKARRELNAILLEKDLISSALTRVYEAEVEKRITKSEREELAARYKKRLKEVDDKFGSAEVTIEVGELERLREELMGLFEGKMRQIEDRLREAHTKLDRIKGPVHQLQLRPAVEELEEVEEEVEKGERKEKDEQREQQQKPLPKRSRAVSRSEGDEVDDKVKELREEVLEALARLEQMDIEG